AAERIGVESPCSTGPEGQPPSRGRPSADPRSLAHRAGVRDVAAVEIVVAADGGEPRRRVDRQQQRPELRRRTAAEIVRGPGQEITTFLPRAGAGVLPRGEERIERGAVRRVDAIRPGRSVAERSVVLRAGYLDPRQI